MKIKQLLWFDKPGESKKLIELAKNANGNEIVLSDLIFKEWSDENFSLSDTQFIAKKAIIMLKKNDNKQISDK
jgi:hypothetical protein